MSETTEVLESNGSSAAWRETVREAMRRACRAEAERRHGERNPSFDYRWEHVSAVATLALRLAELTGADADIVEAAAWLHDVRKDAMLDHPRQGAIFAREFLPETDFPPAKIEAVARAIEDHMGLWRDEPLENLESQVLWDADKLTKIGLTAAVHWSGKALAGEKQRSTRDLIARARTADWHRRTVESMHTKPAQAAARKRLKAFDALWDGLEAELEGEDLLPEG
jgi:uncharacterized protein